MTVLGVLGVLGLHGSTLGAQSAGEPVGAVPFSEQPVIRVVILSGLAAIGYLVFLRRNRLPFHIVIVFALLGAGAAAVLFPEATDEIAHYVGVGRGVDLITYILELAFIYVLIHYYTKFVELQRQQTRLTRELAILRAELERVTQGAPAAPPRETGDEPSGQPITRSATADARTARDER